MSKKKAKIETVAEARNKAKAELAKHLERTGKVEKAVQTEAKEPKARKKAEHKDGTMSGLDAAAVVLKGATGGKSVREICETAKTDGLWSPAGKTPWATLASAIGREIKAKGKVSRFAKVAKGRFALAQVRA